MTQSQAKLIELLHDSRKTETLGEDGSKFRVQLEFLGILDVLEGASDDVDAEYGEDDEDDACSWTSHYDPVLVAGVFQSSLPTPIRTAQPGGEFCE